MSISCDRGVMDNVVLIVLLGLAVTAVAVAREVPGQGARFVNLLGLVVALVVVVLGLLRV